MSETNTEVKTEAAIPMLRNYRPDLISPILFLFDPEKLFNHAMTLNSDIFCFNMAIEPWIFLKGKEGIAYFSHLTMEDVDVFQFRERMAPLKLPGADMPHELPKISRATNQVIKDWFQMVGQDKFSDILSKQTEEYLQSNLDTKGTIDNFHRFIVKAFTNILGNAFLGKEVFNTLPHDLGDVYADIDESVAILPLIFPMMTISSNKTKKAKAKLVRSLLNLIQQRKQTKSATQFDSVLDGYINFQAEFNIDDGNIAWLYNAFLWAALHYCGVHAFWAGIEILTQPGLLGDLQSEQAPIENLSHDNIKKMSLLHGAIKEGIRLNSVFALPRRVVRDLKYKNYRIPKGTVLAISPFIEHHNPIVYPNPSSFNPYRWGEWGSDATSSSFIPGGIGYFGCVGMVFTIHFLTIFWAVLIRNYKFEFIKKPPVVKDSLLLLPPSSPVQLNYEVDKMR